jgi:hypothetical protein
VWRTELEGLGVNESTILREARLEGKREGAIEGTRSALLRLLRSRPGGALPAAIEQRIEQQTDADTLLRWFDLAVSAATLDAFVAGLDG